MQFTVHLRPEVADLVIQKAADNNMTPEALIASNTTNWALASSPDASDQSVAEREYWDLIGQILERYVRSGDWGEDITKKVFEEIESNHRSLFERVIQGDAYESGNPIKHRINKETGSRIKTALDAEVRYTSGGHPIRGFVGKGLISQFTKLFRQDRA